VLVLSLASCGGGGGGSSAPPSTMPGDAAATTSTSTAKASNESSADDSQVADGALLVPGPVPAAWVKATGTPVALAGGAADGRSAVVPCPAGVPTVAGRSTQCTAFDDEGGPYATVRSHNAKGVQQTTLYCQRGTGSDYAPTRTITGRVAASSPAVDDDGGRSFGAVAVESADGVHWYAFRRPVGQDCPMVWGLGIDDGTLAVKASGGSASFPLLGGRTCVVAVAKGLQVTWATKAGTCG